MTSINVQAAQRPEGKPSGENQKEALQEAFMPDEPSGEGEVGGRDMRLVGGRWIYPAFWHYGPYIWWRDGQVYRGDHWHPYSYSPVAYDVDD